jgi:hypothetical protein
VAASFGLGRPPSAQNIYQNLNAAVYNVWFVNDMGSHLQSYNSLQLLHVKGKAVPLQAWSGPEDSRKLRFPDFMTTAQDGGKVVSLTHRPPLPPRNTTGTCSC